MVHLWFFPVSHKNWRKMWVDYWGGKGYVGPSSQIIGVPGTPPLFLRLWVSQCNENTWLIWSFVQCNEKWLSYCSGVDDTYYASAGHLVKNHAINQYDRKIPSSHWTSPIHGSDTRLHHEKPYSINSRYVEHWYLKVPLSKNIVWTHSLLLFTIHLLISNYRYFKVNFLEPVFLNTRARLFKTNDVVS